MKYIVEEDNGELKEFEELYELFEYMSRNHMRILIQAQQILGAKLMTHFPKEQG